MHQYQETAINSRDQDVPQEALTAASGNRKKRRLWPVLLGAIVILLAAGVVVFRSIGYWLIVEDPLQSADAIVVLSGGLPHRSIEAARLFHAGYAPEVWITKSVGYARDLDPMGIQYIGEEVYSREILLRFGVPASAIHILETPVFSTEEEVGVISRQANQTNKTRVIIVTSPPHTRRVRRLWKVLVGEHPQAIVRSSPGDPYDPGRWWHTTQDALAVMRESLGLLNAWAGLPVRPPSR
jgi:uncharacterized SAM-binding protein YcdF (DUF218 family)